MRTTLIQICIFASCLFFCSCDPVYNVDYIIDNQTDQNIRITKKYITETEKATSSISTQTRLIFHTDWGIGNTTKKYLENLNALPFDSLIILNHLGKPLDKDAFDVSNWTKIIPEKDGDIGSITLSVRKEDFK